MKLSTAFYVELLIITIRYFKIGLIIKLYADDFLPSFISSDSNYDNLPNDHHNDLTSADSDVRLARRIQRDNVERGRDVENVLNQVSELVSLTRVKMRALYKFHINYNIHIQMIKIFIFYCSINKSILCRYLNNLFSKFCSMLDL